MFKQDSHSSLGSVGTPAACSFPGEKARRWGALGEARPGQSSLSAGALRYRAWAQSWSHAHGDLNSLAPHERLPEILVVPREKTPTGAAARGNP